MALSANQPDPGAAQLARRALSFGDQAAAYARHRPSYPLAAVRWALEPVAEIHDAETRGAATGSVPRVLDLAAGTGKLTERLLDADLLTGFPGPLDVVAVEPDAQMRAELSRHLPAVPAHAGTAEDIPLPDASVDAVLVGQAMHWFDLDRALPEIARVLRPGGVLAGLWNHDDDSVDWVAGKNEVANMHVSASWRSNALPEHPAFTAFARTEFAHATRHTVDSLLATSATHSWCLVLPDHERAALLDRLRAYLLSRPETAAGEFDLPLITTVVRAVRR